MTAAYSMFANGGRRIKPTLIDRIQDRYGHTIYKHAAKEIAWQQGCAITFMAKWDERYAGSSCHIHASLWDLDGKRSIFKRGAYLYELPWYIFIGAPGSGKTTALLNAGLTFPLAEKMGAVGAQIAASRQLRGEALHDEDDPHAARTLTPTNFFNLVAVIESVAHVPGLGNVLQRRRGHDHRSPAKDGSLGGPHGVGEGARRAHVVDAVQLVLAAK